MLIIVRDLIFMYHVIRAFKIFVSYTKLFVSRKIYLIKVEKYPIQCEDL